MTREEKTALLLQLIAEKSATAEGFFTADAKQFNAETSAAKVCRQQLADGTLFRVRANQTMYAYFRTQVMANAYLRQHQNTLLAKAATKLSFAPKEAKIKPHKTVAEPTETLFSCLKEPVFPYATVIGIAAAGHACCTLAGGPGPVA
jgi:hypothetical protein